ncbi:GFA domain-containing protein [Mycena sanguinolenta]|uniref:GFA domain-containing protein n=1 Tax=Mycena sanguinolenta TaxID=230812 RepID=A0A8H7CGP3_9AGAR|nr:GFA domain-containing protein [Mycena sanguinolenta]
MSDSAREVEHRGGCHCGAFQFTLTVPPIEGALRCNCSICSKNDYLWTFPRRSQFAVVQGDETMLTSYLFGKRGIAHKFCPTCGTSLMEVRTPECKDEKTPEIGINIRALQDFDLDSLKIELFEGGIDLEPAYQVPEPVPTGPAPEGTTAYHGSCHCGAVAYTALLTVEEISEATLCNCSICARDAVLWTYPESTSVFTRGFDTDAVEYTFKRKWVFHGFCKHCGVSIFELFRNTNTHNDTKTVVNVRTINTIDAGSGQWVGMDVGKIKMRVFDGKTRI